MKAPIHLIVATGNAHKVEEIARFLQQSDVKVDSAQVVGGMPAVEETGETFAANARIKAEALRARAANGFTMLADDSGLAVDALDGAPGVHSARYAGPEQDDTANIAKLLDAMEGVPAAERTAHFACSLCLITADSGVTFFEGRCEGAIAFEPAGENGFGYDPVFAPDGYSETFGQLDPAIKNAISHRANALRKLAEWIQQERV